VGYQHNISGYNYTNSSVMQPSYNRLSPLHGTMPGLATTFNLSGLHREKCILQHILVVDQMELDPVTSC